MPEFAALSVLVLAWDEAAPTLRTLIEAAPAVGSLLVLLPPIGPAPAGAATPATEALIAATYPAPTEPAANAATPAAPAAPPPTAAPRPETAGSPTKAAAPLAAVASAGLPAAAVSALPAFRMLYLPAGLPPATRRAGTYQVPAAPYLGATPGASPPLPPVPAVLPSPAASSLPPATAEAATPNATTADVAVPAENATGSQLTTVDAPAVEAAPPAPPVAESQLPEPEPPLADMVFRADEIVDPDPEQELQVAPLETPAATPADAPALLDLPPLPNHGPFGQRLPATEPAAYVPTARPTRPDDQDAEPLPPNEPAPRPAPQYPAPDLNNQIIRYARQAVPTALAEGPFQVLYAPAWPTWLAAIELRQRSGRPLVLHLAALAAGRQAADTAAGWPAEIQRQALRQADLVLVDTYALARRLRRELGLASGAVRVVTPGDAGAIARALRRAHRG